MRGRQATALASAVLTGIFTVAGAVPGATTLEAQQIGASGHVSTLGIGGNLALGLSPIFGVRAGLSVQPWEPEREIDDVAVTASFSSPVYSLLVDFHPFMGSFHLTGGMIQFGDNISMVGTPVRPVEVNGVTYQPSEVGSVTAVIVTKKRTPYLGIGWGSPAKSAFGVTFDVGVAFQGRPGLQVTADGPFAGDPLFQANLDAEVARLEDDISSFKYYPVVSIGLGFGAF